MTFLIGLLLGGFIGAVLGFIASGLCAAAHASVEDDSADWEDEG
jgi:hypothetical protein